MNKFVFGMPTLVEFDTLEDNVKLCKKLGLSFIELNMNLPQFQIERIDIKKLVDIQRNEHIFFTFHLPEELDVANFNAKIKKAYYDIVKETIEVAKIIDCPIINMHMHLGVYFTMPDEKIYLYEKYYNDFYNSILKFGNFADKLINKSNVKISIENTGIYNRDYIITTIKELLNRESFSLTWDVGHDYSSGNIDRNFIMENMGKLKHMHIHDGKGKSNHLPLFCGDIDLYEKLKIAEETKSSCVIETKTTAGLKQSVLELRRLGYL